jgi:hypothetical protein
MYKTNFSGTSQSISMLQHELHLWIYYMSKFLNTSEFIIMIRYFVTYQVPWFARGSVSFALIRAGIRRKIQNLWQPRYNTKCHRKKKKQETSRIFVWRFYLLPPCTVARRQSNFVSFTWYSLVQWDATKHELWRFDSYIIKKYSFIEIY